MQAEKPVQGRLRDGEAAPQPANDCFTCPRYGGEQVSDHRGAPKTHLAPGQHITHEGRGHHQDKDDYAQPPQQLPRRLVRTVIHAPEDMNIDHGKEHGTAVSMHIAQQPAIIDVAHDMLGAGEGQVRMGRVMHGQDDAGDDLHHQHDASQGSHVPPVVQIFWCRIDHQGFVDETEDRQPIFNPFDNGIVRLKA